jgi:hypothetical protein
MAADLYAGSRVGFTEAIRQQFKKRSTNKDQKLTVRARLTWALV